MGVLTLHFIPAEAGISGRYRRLRLSTAGIPAFAGMTGK